MKTCYTILPRSRETEGIDHIELMNETSAANLVLEHVVLVIHDFCLHCLVEARFPSECLASATSTDPNRASGLFKKMIQVYSCHCGSLGGTGSNPSL
jgi:hypothetical protein